MAIKATIEMENGKKMTLELYPEYAPQTVENFVELANEHFYDGLIFHRVIDGFMIQGGDPTGTGMGGSENIIRGEFRANGVNNTIKHKRGTVSMARTNEPNSASSQFFIVQRDSLYLDGQYAAFGRVTEGMEVVDEIASCKTDYNDRPVVPQRIKRITLDQD